MCNSDIYLENSRSAKPFRPGGHPGFGQGMSAAAREEEPQRVEGMKIAQTAAQSIGLSTKDPWGPPKLFPEYALAVSLIFTKATNQTIILGTPPKHVLSTSILWASLLHDKRFTQIPMSEAAPGDIIIGSGWQQGADDYAGIVVDHGRIVSNSSQGVQDNSSLLELQRTHPEMTAFRYVGFWNYYRKETLANAGYDPDEPRVPAGQPGGGRWTAGGTGSRWSSLGPRMKALRDIDGRKPKVRLCGAGEQITPEYVETEPVLREKEELEKEAENFRKLTPQEQAQRDEEAKAEELTKQAIKDAQAEASGKKQSQKPQSFFDQLHQYFGWDAKEQPEKESNPDSPDQKPTDESKSPQDRGRDSEGRVLKDTGKEKNTKTFSTSQGDTIPDFVTEEEVGEIKDSKKVSNTRQMRAEREVAKDQEKDHVVITGNNTQVSQPLVQSGSKIVRRPDLGPQMSK
jgi:hypothetical protein